MSSESKLEEFKLERERLNQKIIDQKHTPINRFFRLDTAAYEEGALPAKTKELCGLAASMVLRCDDCISYHLIQCAKEGCSREEIFEVFNVGLVVGGSIVIPHLRRAVDLLDELGVS